MSCILYAWELGDSYGHINGFLPLALVLRQRGHQVIFALRDLSHAHILLGGDGFPYVQAPLWLPVSVGLPSPPLNYAEILHQFGYLDAMGLSSLVRAWRQLYDLVQPDLLIADHAPTALLAASGTGIPRTLIGNGFFSPPRVSPTPNMRPWLDLSQERLIQSDAMALAVINSVLTELGVPPLNILTDLFGVEENFLCTFPELDHYPHRGAAHYWGPVFSLQGDVDPSWSLDERPRIFVYFHSCHREFPQIVSALRDLSHQNPSCQICIHAPDLTTSLIQQYQTDRLRFSVRPLNLGQVRQQCDLAICHGGHGTTTAMLLAGVPLLLLPLHLEEYLLSQRVAEWGAALVIDPEAQTPNYCNLIDQLLQNSTFKERAQAFANRYSNFDQKTQITAMAERCEELVQRAQNTSPDREPPWREYCFN